jgi:hypothetical protein
VQLRPGGRHLGCGLCCCAWTGAASTVTVLIAVGVVGALWSYDSGNTTAVNSELQLLSRWLGRLQLLSRWLGWWATSLVGLSECLVGRLHCFGACAGLKDAICNHIYTGLLCIVNCYRSHSYGALQPRLQLQAARVIWMQGDINQVYSTAVELLFKSGGIPQLNRQCLLD